MKFLLILIVPVLLFADNITCDNKWATDDLLYRGPKIHWPDNWKHFEVAETKNDTSTTIISIDKNTVKIERTYTVKDTIIYKR